MTFTAVRSGSRFGSGRRKFVIRWCGWILCFTVGEPFLRRSANRLEARRRTADDRIERKIRRRFTDAGLTADQLALHAGQCEELRRLVILKEATTLAAFR
jgi:hypothetical protein